MSTTQGVFHTPRALRGAMLSIMLFASAACDRDHGSRYSRHGELRIALEAEALERTGLLAHVTEDVWEAITTLSVGDALEKAEVERDLAPLLAEIVDETGPQRTRVDEAQTALEAATQQLDAFSSRVVIRRRTVNRRPQRCGDDGCS